MGKVRERSKLPGAYETLFCLRTYIKSTSFSLGNDYMQTINDHETNASEVQGEKRLLNMLECYF